MTDSVISIKNATVMLEREKILDALDWQVKTGENWFLLGTNGAGKTTLVKMLMGFVWPLFGAKISVLGNVYGKSNLSEVRKRIAWVSPFLQAWTSSRWKAIELVLSGLDGTIGLFRENVTAKEKSLALKQMEALGCENIAEHYYDRLSSGEQVKVLIARALISNPELLILDEPCVHLDMKSREYLLSSIDELAGKKSSPSMIFISHHIEDISPVFKFGLLLKNGKIIAKGEREKILTEAKLSEAFELPVKLTKSANGRYWPAVH
jgi:iron complex transport system ATP-binding protein